MRAGSIDKKRIQYDDYTNKFNKAEDDLQAKKAALAEIKTHQTDDNDSNNDYSEQINSAETELFNAHRERNTFPSGLYTYNEYYAKPPEYRDLAIINNEIQIALTDNNRIKVKNLRKERDKYVEFIEVNNESYKECSEAIEQKQEEINLALATISKHKNITAALEAENKRKCHIARCATSKESNLTKLKILLNRQLELNIYLHKLENKRVVNNNVEIYHNDIKRENGVKMCETQNCDPEPRPNYILADYLKHDGPCYKKCNNTVTGVYMNKDDFLKSVDKV